MLHKISALEAYKVKTVLEDVSYSHEKKNWFSFILVCLKIGIPWSVETKHGRRNDGIDVWRYYKSHGWITIFGAAICITRDA